jgi:excisionase family DNA binding protein
MPSGRHYMFNRAISSSAVARTATMGKEWLGAPAAASLLGIRLKTLYGLINSGYVPAYKIGRVIRLRRREVMAYVEGCRIKPGTLAHLYPPGDKRRRSGADV